MGGSGQIKVDATTLRDGAKSLSGHAQELQQIASLLHRHSREIRDAAGFPAVADACQDVIERITTALIGLEHVNHKASRALTDAAHGVEKADRNIAQTFSGGASG